MTHIVLLMILNIPNRSEGYLCITPSSNNSIETIINNILEGNVKLVILEM